MFRSRVVTLGVAALVLTACGGNGAAAPQKKTELTLYNDKGAWTKYFDEMGALSKQSIGLGMKPTGYTDSAQYQAFIKASFRTNVKPDLFTWQTGGMLEEIVKQKQVADTTAIWQEAIKAGDLSQDLAPYYTIGGKQYCVPMNVAYWGMFFNKKVFDKYGLKPPATWDELITVAETLKKNGVKAFYHTSVLFSFVWFEQLMAGMDPDLYDRLSTGKAKYTDPGVVQVMEKWKTLIDAGYFVNPGDKTDPGDVLKNGKAAMVSFGTWFNTSMSQRNLKPGTDYDFFVIPNVNPALPKTSMIFESGPLCSLTKAADPDAGLKYLKWWTTSQAQEKWATSRGDVSANPKVEIADKALGAVTKDAGGGKYRLVNRYFEATPPPILTAALDGFSKFVTEPGTYKEVLETIQKAADEYWSTHQ
ncbi:multiple sugar transport system substrate-binding protein/raffinose/stachyose/melibiose transport system substrate-binding protein [Nonomuraea solani]|uniref:Multiple sugar transport system substrate-binding protein/raffinose/stachyose/melibiose transport system substrate-binding protein n=1 Tax=Nonomuraea solani TaxID=1144553 RepID=A0A1H6D475_9ACTN|nr:ABC transporter substrate-binding protein [Nonomuraea solani]SEG80137.1 multiple sugar transport system substrate-binding protein/raffinose/stachyose/melibiose transport system substrate-binding protein [Nonomuraea solani]